MTPALEMRGVGLVRDDRALLADVDWSVHPGERWVVLGRNGSGKTSLVRIASLYLHPSSGEVFVLGERLGRTDVRTLRTRIGLASSALAAVIISAALTLFDFESLRWLWRVRRSELWLSLVALLGVAVFGALEGIVVAIALSVGNFVRRAWRPHDAVLGRIDGRP
jgi:ABC-type uncharacterized transport system ATPase subunit